MLILNGIEVTRELNKFAPRPAVVICSVETDSEMVEGARKAGAGGYVFKTGTARDFVAAVQFVARSDAFLSSA